MGTASLSCVYNAEKEQLMDHTTLTMIAVVIIALWALYWKSDVRIAISTRPWRITLEAIGRGRRS